MARLLAVGGAAVAASSMLLLKQLLRGDAQHRQDGAPGADGQQPSPGGAVWSGEVHGDAACAGGEAAAGAAAAGQHQPLASHALPPGVEAECSAAWADASSQCGADDAGDAAPSPARLHPSESFISAVSGDDDGDVCGGLSGLLLNSPARAAAHSACSPSACREPLPTQPGAGTSSSSSRIQRRDSPDDEQVEFVPVQLPVRLRGPAPQQQPRAQRTSWPDGLPSPRPPPPEQHQQQQPQQRHHSMQPVDLAAADVEGAVMTAQQWASVRTVELPPPTRRNLLQHGAGADTSGGGADGGSGGSSTSRSSSTSPGRLPADIAAAGAPAVAGARETLVSAVAAGDGGAPSSSRFAGDAGSADELTSEDEADAAQPCSSGSSSSSNSSARGSSHRRALALPPDVAAAAGSGGGGRQQAVAAAGTAQQPGHLRHSSSMQSGTLGDWPSLQVAGLSAIWPGAAAQPEPNPSAAGAEAPAAAKQHQQQSKRQLPPAPLPPSHSSQAPAAPPPRQQQQQAGSPQRLLQTFAADPDLQQQLAADVLQPAAQPPQQQQQQRDAPRQPRLHLEPTLPSSPPSDGSSSSTSTSTASRRSKPATGPPARTAAAADCGSTPPAAAPPPGLASQQQAVLLEQPGVTQPASNHAAAAAAGGPWLRLVVCAGPGAGQRFDTSLSEHKEFVIGRSPAAWASIPDQEVSGRHASLAWCASNKCWQLCDAGSLNGTFVNGRPISLPNRQPGGAASLKHGDQLHLGSTTRAQVECSGGCDGSSNSGGRGTAAAAAAAARGAPGAAAAAPDVAAARHGDTFSREAALAAAGAFTHHQQQQQQQQQSRLSQAATPPAAAAEASACVAAAAVASGSNSHSSSSCQAVLPARPGGHLSPVILLQFLSCRVEGAVAKMVGADHRRTQCPCEDVVAWRTPLGELAQLGLFCVFDGHHSRDASEQAQQLLPDLLAGHLAQQQQPQEQQQPQQPQQPQQQQQQPVLANEAAVAEALTASFLGTDQRLTTDDGCTATALLLEGCPDGSLLLRVANVGDSMALLVNLGSACWQALTEDHRIAANASEAARLAAKNALQPGVLHQRLYGLNIGRMLGDRYLKEADVGFTAQPYISEGLALGPADEGLLLLASDGLWDVLPPERVAALAVRVAREHGAAAAAEHGSSSSRSSKDAAPASGTSAAAAGAGRSSQAGSSSSSGTSVAAAVADALLHGALRLRSRDDISIMVLHVLPAAVAGQRPALEHASASGSM